MKAAVKIPGATVAAIDVTDEKLELAREFGADLAIYETRPLSLVNESIDAVLRGEIKARIVFDLGTGR
ncbi:hypothetical protein ACWGBH_20375 [Streptomyces massasporeus]